jgi:hypothetical protein
MTSSKHILILVLGHMGFALLNSMVIGGLIRRDRWMVCVLSLVLALLYGCSPPKDSRIQFGSVQLDIPASYIRKISKSPEGGYEFIEMKLSFRLAGDEGSYIEDNSSGQKSYDYQTLEDLDYINLTFTPTAKKGYIAAQDSRVLRRKPVGTWQDQFTIYRRTDDNSKDHSYLVPITTKAELSNILIDCGLWFGEADSPVRRCWVQSNYKGLFSFQYTIPKSLLSDWVSVHLDVTEIVGGFLDYELN